MFLLSKRFLAFALLAGALLLGAPGARAQQVTTTITMPNQSPPVVAAPQGVAIDTVRNMAYVSVPYYDISTGTHFTGQIAVIDGATDTLVTMIPVGLGPWGAGVNPDTHKLYVANQVGGGIHVIDTLTNTVIKNIFPGSGFSGVAVDRQNNRIYVGVENSPHMVEIDGATDTYVASHYIGVSRPALHVLNAQTGRLYISNNSGVSQTMVFDTATKSLVNAIPLSDEAGPGVALDLVNQRLYVRQYFIEKFGVVDLATETVTALIALPPSPAGFNPPLDLAYNPTTNRIYVTRAFDFDRILYVYDAASLTLINTVAVGSYQIGVNPLTNKIYVTDRLQDIDGRNLAGLGAINILVDNRLPLANAGADRKSVV